MAAPNLQHHDPVAARQLHEIAQYTQDIRYKPGKQNLTADALSRPAGVPPGQAYCPEIDVIAAIKTLVTDQLSPTNILQEQLACQTNNIIYKGRKTVQNVKFRGQDLLCETSSGTPKPVSKLLDAGTLNCNSSYK